MDPLSELLLDFYRRAQDCPPEQFRERALALLARVTAFDSARWGSGLFAASGLMTHDAHLHNEPPEMLTAYEEVRAQDDRVIARYFDSNGTHTLRIHPATHYAGRGYRAIRDYMRRFRHENVACVAHVRATDRYVNYMSLYRADEPLQFGADHEEVLKRLFPHMLEALRINALLYAQARAPAMRHPESGFGIADTLGAIDYAEPRASQLLADEWPASRNGRLPSVLVESLASGGRYRGARVCAAASLTQGMVFFRVRPLCPADTLSPRELQVARAIARGATQKVAAAELKISTDTVRSHLHHIHDKLGVHNRAQLVAALAHLD